MKKFALNQGTLLNLPLDQFLNIAIDTGYQGVGLWFDCIEKNVEVARKLIKDSNLDVIELTFRQPWLFVNGEEKKHLLHEFENACQFARDINADFLCLPAYGDKDGDLKLGANNFIELCELAKKYDLKIGIENLPWSCLDTILSTWKFIQSSKQQNAGIVVDAFHVFKSNSPLEDLNQIPIANIYVVHMRDSSNKDKNIDLLTQAREHGLFPGEGDFNLTGLIRQLRHMNYQGYYSLEVLNKKLKNIDPKTIAQKGINSLESIIN